MGDEEICRKSSGSSCESWGKHEEKKQARYSFCWRPQDIQTSNRMDETFEEEVEPKPSKNCISCWLVPLRSSRRTRPGIEGSIRISRTEVGRGLCLYCHVRKRGASFEREWNRGHALTAPGTHQPQSRGEPMATSFQCLQTWRKVNVPVTKRVPPFRRPDSTM